MEYWASRLDEAGGDLSAIIDAFGTSQEYQEAFGDLSEEELVNNLFLQLFNREADEEGLAFYTTLLESGTKSLASISMDILNGAQNDDAVILDNKLKWVEEFTLKIEVENKEYDDAAAVTIKLKLTGIDESDEALIAALAEIDGIIGELELEVEIETELELEVDAEDEPDEPEEVEEFEPEEFEPELAVSYLIIDPDVFGF